MKSTLAGLTLVVAGLAASAAGAQQFYPAPGPGYGYGPGPAYGAPPPGYRAMGPGYDPGELTTGSIGPGVPAADFSLAAPHEIQYYNGVPCRTIYIPSERRRVPIACAPY